MKKVIGILNGLFGFFLLVAVLLGVATFLGIQAWKTQKIQASNAYVLETQEIKAKSTQNAQYYKLVR